MVITAQNFCPTKLALGVHIGLLTVATPALAHAQTPQTDTASLETLAVTFEEKNRYAVPKTNGSVGLTLSNKETPQMVSILNQARISDQNLKTMKEVVDNTTGIHVSNIDGGRVNFSSRGFYIHQFNVDGADMDFNQQMSVGEYHLGTDIYDKIEITHGATGLVSGSGEPSARINLVRKKAVYHDYATLSANINRFGNYGASLDYAKALSADGSMRGRIIASHQDGKTFVDREQKGQSTFYATVQKDWGDNGTLDIGAMYRKNKQQGVMWGGLPSYYNDGTRTDWHVGKSNSVNWANISNEVKEYFVHLSKSFHPDWQFNIKATHNDTKGSPKAYWHAYSVVDKATGFGVPSSPDYLSSRYRADNTHRQTHLQADITGHFTLFEQNHQIMLGAHHNHDKLTAYTYPPQDTPINSNIYTWDGSYPQPRWANRKSEPDATVKTTEKSLYAATQLKINQPLSLILGARLSHYAKNGVQWGRQVSSHAKGVLIPYAGLSFDINQNHALYASYTSIFQPQSARNLAGDYLPAILGNTYEIGLKSSSQDHKLQAQATLFYTKQDNLAKALNAQYVQGTENTTKEQAYTTTQGNTSKGIEIEVSGKLSPTWQVMAGVSHFNAKDNNQAPINTTSPNQMVKLWSIYDLSPLVQGLSIGGGINWLGERYAKLTNPSNKQQEHYTQKPTALVNLMARYSPDDNLDVQLNVSNALNQKYLSGIESRWSQIIYGEPYNISGSVTYRF